MAFGLAQLRLLPAAFWALTPRELACLAGFSTRAAETLPPNIFADLMQRYPD